MQNYLEKICTYVSVASVPTGKESEPVLCVLPGDSR